MIAINDEGWTEDTSRDFIDNGAFFVPGREKQIETVCALIPDRGRLTRVVELCCGDGLLSGEVLRHHPMTNVLALDGSVAMLRAAERALAEFNGRFSTQLFDLHARHWRDFPEPVDAFISSLAIHHLDDAEKRQLFKDLYQALSPGGVVAIADVIRPASPAANRIAGREWDAAVKERSNRLKGDDSAFEFFVSDKWNMYTNEMDEVDKPSGLLDQLLWMKDAGFDGVDVYWMQAGHAIFGGARPE
jgi:tRNA (cmo5U34)-methyltransferase